MTALSYTLISFPGLGLELDPPSTIQLGPLTIHFYGLIIAVGMLLAVLYASKRSKEFGLKEDDLIDGVLWVTPFAIICARLYYCIFEWDQYASNPISILYIWNGGLAIYGGVLGAVIGLSVFCKVRKIKATAMMDIVSLGLLIGQSVGRWGNFMNREAFGAPTDSFLRMGLYNTATGAVEYYHPTFLYESLWNFVGFLLLHFLSKKRKYDGQVALGYVAWYGLGRAFIEGLRMDSLYWGPFRVSQVLAGVSCVAAVAVLLWQGFRPHDPTKMLVNQVSPEKSQEAPKAEDEFHENEG
ncbi:MAG: prolipoprotein diacylglyceryl transferase [Candidatus Faecousia sp.]|nr:prolipoprotein diacylglyceryl transferase [Clostridiales bacterium]MDD6298057.1 prolipoprotein diacylglyceryl transferase [Bacillota bacterium]MDD7341382.1 prolipoprotein diacylglyceryl transferase [Bacillota bacterium]MDY2810048.1 prolipoprotein diacylglyceryl transferase [Candidatus Faecousia sp.]